MVDHRATNAHLCVGGKAKAAILKAVGGLDQCDHADLQQILDLDGAGDTPMHMPGDLADQRHILLRQLVR